jgi:DNA-binding HxlR family transcriptional regulator
MSDAADNGRARSFAPTAPEVLESLYQHKLLSTPQIHELHTPAATMRWTQQVLAELAGAELVQAIGTRTRPPTKLWFLTPAGHETVEAAPHLESRRKEVTLAGAAGQLQAHTLAVNDVGVAFVRAARERGDECGPLAWRHEIAHPVGAGAGRGARGGELVIADAVLRYTLYGEQGDDFLTRFVELDRATMPMEDLASKLRYYARLHRYVPEGASAPGWRALYPAAFPAVLLIFTGKERSVLERRMRTLLGRLGQDLEISSVDELVIYCALLEDLISEGPFVPIFLRHDDPSGYVDWLGTPELEASAADSTSASADAIAAAHGAPANERVPARSPP